jgi:signal transduction histidine kinase
MVGKNHFALYPNEEKEAVFRRVIETGEGVEFHDIKFVCPDLPKNSVTYWDLTLEPVKDIRGCVIGLVISLIDTTERKKAEAALGADLGGISLLRDLSMRLIVEDDIHTFYQGIIDAAVILAKANTGTLQIFEKGSLRFVSSHGVHQPFLDYFADADKVASACGRAAQRNERVIVPDVETSPIFAGTPSLQVLLDANIRASQSTPLVSRKGELLGVLNTHWNRPYEPNEQDLWRIDLLVRQAADFIERRRGEDALRRSNAELQHFAYVASHDLQEPLRMLSSYLTMFERKNKETLDEKSKMYLDYALDGAKRMQAMIEDLLTYSRVETKGHEFRPVSMDNALSLALRDLKVRIEESGASITHDVLPTVRADEGQIVMLLENLIGNAIKYRSVAAPQIHLSAHSEKNDWVFAVQDNGIGIDPRDKDRIFQMFQRLHTREEYTGTGMGLAIAKKIVERHDGRIWFESIPDQGSTFFFTIPVHDA